MPEIFLKAVKGSEFLPYPLLFVEWRKFLDLPTHGYANIVVFGCDVLRQLQHAVVGVECWLHFELEVCGYSVQTIHCYVGKLLAGDWILSAELSAFSASVNVAFDWHSSTVYFVRLFLWHNSVYDAVDHNRIVAFSRDEFGVVYLFHDFALLVPVPFSFEDELRETVVFQVFQLSFPFS